MAKAKKSDKAIKEKIKKSDKSRTGGIFYPTERKIIERLVKRLPRYLTPDRMTALSIFSYFCVGLCFYLTTFSKWWFIGVPIFFIINWFGDSFDGEIARYRNIQRPRFGYYVDHLLDSVGAVFLVVGLGISPLMQVSISFAIIILFLLISISTYLAVYTQGRYKIGYGGVGGTEGRIIISLFAIVSLFFTYPMNLFHLFGTVFTAWDVAGFLVSLLLLFMFILGVVQNLNYLNKIDRKTYKEISLSEYWEKSIFLNRLRNSEFGKLMSGETMDAAIKDWQKANQKKKNSK